MYIHLNDALSFINKEYKILFEPPKRLRVTNGRNMATRTSVCVYQHPVTWIFTRTELSDSDYKVIHSLKCITLL